MINERKLADYIEVEKKLMQEIEQLKNERDQKVLKRLVKQQNVANKYIDFLVCRILKTT